MSDGATFAGLSHRLVLFVAYAITMLVWTRVARRWASVWPKPAPIRFAHPWREIGFFLLAVVAVLLVGQLYMRGWLLPARGAFGPLLEAANQLLIFLPVIVLPFVRRRALVSDAPGGTSAVLAGMWLPTHRLWVRLLVGVLLSLLAVLVFTTVRAGSRSFVDVAAMVYHPRNLGHLVQVLCEDVAIAILFVRVRAALGLSRTIVVVAVLFAAAHIPALLAGGAVLQELAGLVLDAGLGVMVLYFLQRSGDVWWFWWVHFGMDMMQFYAVPDETSL